MQPCVGPLLTYEAAPAFCPTRAVDSFHVGVSPESTVSDAALMGPCMQDQRLGNAPLTGKLV